MTKFKKQPDKYINNRLMRYSPRFNAWVDIQGTYVYREYNDPSKNGPLSIYTRADGSKYVAPKFPGIIEMDIFVALCWKPEPQNGKNADRKIADRKRRQEIASCLLFRF